MTFLTLLIVLLIGRANAHGALVKPAARQVAHRIGFLDVPNNDNWMGLAGGGPAHVQALGPSVCGDTIQTDVSRTAWNYQAPGRWATGTITGWYSAGSTISATVAITAHHKGYFELKLCKPEASSPHYRNTQACFDAHVLDQANGGGPHWQLPDEGARSYTFEYQLPVGLTCDNCVLQWHWRTGNSPGAFPEEFWNCADIQIVTALSAAQEESMTRYYGNGQPGDDGLLDNPCPEDTAETNSEYTYCWKGRLSRCVNGFPQQGDDWMSCTPSPAPATSSPSSAPSPAPAPSTSPDLGAPTPMTEPTPEPTPDPTPDPTPEPEPEPTPISEPTSVATHAPTEQPTSTAAPTTAPTSGSGNPCEQTPSVVTGYGEASGGVCVDGVQGRCVRGVVQMGGAWMECTASHGGDRPAATATPTVAPTAVMTTAAPAATPVSAPTAPTSAPTSTSTPSPTLPSTGGDSGDPTTDLCEPGIVTGFGVAAGGRCVAGVQARCVYGALQMGGFWMQCSDGDDSVWGGRSLQRQQQQPLTTPLTTAVAAQAEEAEELSILGGRNPESRHKQNQATRSAAARRNSAAPVVIGVCFCVFVAGVVVRAAGAALFTNQSSAMPAAEASQAPQVVVPSGAAMELQQVVVL